MKTLKTYSVSIFAALAILSGSVAAAQTPDSSAVAVPVEVLAAKADSLRSSFRFGKAADLYRQAMENAPSDSLKTVYENLVLMSENADNMSQYCSQPVVVSKQRFSLKDFFLYYPLEDKGWKALPNMLDSTASGFAKAVFIPKDAEELFYTKPDENGIYNIYRTEFQDTVWSVPELIDEKITSSSDEIFPMAYDGGNTLYFASKGLQGMGGYDLYVTRKNRGGNWDTPENLGFPYSSPADDFLFINSPDGRYSLFASNRECAADSVYIYVLEYDAMPLRKAIDIPEELQNLTRLQVQSDPSRIDHASAVDSSVENDVDIRRYTEKMSQVRQIKDYIAAVQKRIESLRDDLSVSSEGEKSRLIGEITEMEMESVSLGDDLHKAEAELRQIEMEFLLDGVVIDPEKVRMAADKEVVGAESGYTFARNEMGEFPQMNILKPKPVFDYTFKILPVGRFAEDNTLPDGLIYQIQLFAVSTQATEKSLKGLSPVFERRNTAGKYIYSAGLFKTYSSVLSNLNKVKRAGFKYAQIVAFYSGEPISVSEARSLEK